MLPLAATGVSVALCNALPRLFPSCRARSQRIFIVNATRCIGKPSYAARGENFDTGCGCAANREPVFDRLLGAFRVSQPFSIILMRSAHHAWLAVQWS